jgi:uncharacterized protein
VALSLYELANETFAPMLRSLSGILDKGAAHARANGLAPTALPAERLAPDMYTLAKQVQLACSNARECVEQLTDHPPKWFDENETTFDELKAHIDTTIDYLAAIPKRAFAGADKKAIAIPLPEDGMAIVMNGAQFLRDWGIPHFYFHVVTAYDILRHNGVEIGKRDYLARVGSYIQRR